MKRQLIINIFVEILGIAALIGAVVRKNRTNIIVTAVFCAVYLVFLLWEYMRLKNARKKEAEQKKS